uniref:PRTase-CE domain-containing protein n=1 Tax=Candidatus Kentrum sp. TUN TaxID=2126343 RepID=A0A450ZNX2_9GAMM|nr:MAG: hypothetical protein BECKTUN1418D_GA0071000_10327 [Candidatus Kentron sp. TUN]
MKSAAGRIVLFDALAEGISLYHPDTNPRTVALSINGMESKDDRISLAEAVCRIYAEFSRYIHVYRARDLETMTLSGNSVIDAERRKTSEIVELISGKVAQNITIVIVDHSDNDTKGLHELRFIVGEERKLMEISVRKLFREVNVEYDPLATVRFLQRGFEKLNNDFDLFEDSPAIDQNADHFMEEFCHTISESWRYDDQPVDGNHVYKWFNQFKEADFSDEAREVLKYLKRKGFVTRRAIVANLISLFNDLKENLDSEPVVVSIQPIGKSESFLAYSLRPQIKFEEMKDALDEASNANSVMDLVCFDDVVISGRSMQDYLFNPKINEKADPLSRAMREEKIHLTILVAFADVRGIAAIENDPRGHGAISVKAANLIGDKDRAFHPSSEIFSENIRKEDFRGFCKQVGNKINRRNPLGWKNAQWCVVMDYTVPNGTLPILWASSHLHSWIPLFPRSRTSS